MAERLACLLAVHVGTGSNPKHFQTNVDATKGFAVSVADTTEYFHYQILLPGEINNDVP